MRWFTAKLLPLAIVLGLVWLGTEAYSKYSGQAASEVSNFNDTEAVDPLLLDESVSSRSFSCDGRTRCSEMTSCEEAMYFLEYCPGVKMDGGGDGVPCERQWCGDR
jgi:hypothetical protein